MTGKVHSLPVSAPIHWPPPPCCGAALFLTIKAAIALPHSPCRTFFRLVGHCHARRRGRLGRKEVRLSNLFDSYVCARPASGVRACNRHRRSAKAASMGGDDRAIPARLVPS